jgi:hypothetical protein
VWEHAACGGIVLNKRGKEEEERKERKSGERKDRKIKI